MAKRTRRQKVHDGREFLDFISTIMAPRGENSFKKSICEPYVKESIGEKANNKFVSLMENIGERFTITSNKWDKKIILSILSPHITEPILRFYIPGLTHRQFINSRKIIGDETQEHEPYRRARYDAAKVNLFISFITRYADDKLT